MCSYYIYENDSRMNDRKCARSDLLSTMHSMPSQTLTMRRSRHRMRRLVSNKTLAQGGERSKSSSSKAFFCIFLHSSATEKCTVHCQKQGGRSRGSFQGGKAPALDQGRIGSNQFEHCRLKS